VPKSHAELKREAQIVAMQHAGRELAVQWGHQPWSESWARLVAETLLDASEAVERVLEAA
jgi:hypothetical protein